MPAKVRLTPIIQFLWFSMKMSTIFKLFSPRNVFGLLRIKNISYYLFLTSIFVLTSDFIVKASGKQTPPPVVHENLCLEDDYTNDLPIFIEKRTICNFDATPVPIYTIKISPDTPGNRFCLKGESAEKFNITKEKEVHLFERLSQPETNLRLQIIRLANDFVGTVGERRQAINAIQFTLIVEDCNQISWQTILVAVLSSVCVVLMSTLAIMLILYQQRGLIKSSNNDDDKTEEQVPTFATGFRDESFINPRRTSSYEFSTLSRNSAATIERAAQESENL